MENATLVNSPEVKPAGLWVRFWANVVDGLIIGVPIILIFSLTHIINPHIFLTINLQNSPIFYVTSLLSFIYSIYLTVNKGATWGKDAYGLQVVRYKTAEFISYKRAFVRDLIRLLPGITYIPIVGGLISFIAVIIDIFLILFGKEKRTIHDRIAGTQVIKSKSAWSAKKQLLILLPLLILVFVSGYEASINLTNKNYKNTGSIDYTILNSNLKKLHQEQNAQRLNDINVILNAINKYSIEHNGEIPNIILSTPLPIGSRTQQVDLCKYLVPKYLSALPVDPEQAAAYALQKLSSIEKESLVKDCSKAYYIGYVISKDASNKITVSAPLATRTGKEIEVTR